MKPTIIKFALAIAFLSTQGCSSVLTRDIDRQVDAQNSEWDLMKQNAKSATPIEKLDAKPLVRRVSGDYYPVTKIENSVGTSREEPWAKRRVSVNRRFMTIAEASSYVTGLTGLPVIVDPKLAKSASASFNGMGMTGMTGMGMTGVGTTGLPPYPSGTGNVNNQALMMQSAMATQQQITYDGDVAGLMDLLSAKYNAYWEKTDKGIHVYRTKPMTFRIVALPGDTEMSSKIATQSTSGGSSSSGSATGSSGSSGSQSNNASQLATGFGFSSLSVWKSIEDGVKTMLSEDGRVVVTPATGTITVDDNPNVLSRVAEYVKAQNESLSKQVVVNVKVLSVDLTNNDGYGINWNAVYQNLNRNFGLSLAGTLGTLTSAPSLTLNTVGNSMYAGTSAMVNALSTQGKVSEVTSASIITLNNQPAPIQVAREVSYLASSTTSIGVGGAGNTTTLNPATVTTGFSMNVLPHILDTKKVLMQYSTDISTLNAMNTISSNGSTMQNPDVDRRDFQQRVTMNSGEMLIMTGFEQFSLSSNLKGVGKADNALLGGSVNGNRHKTVLVVLIQPVILGEK